MTMNLPPVAVASPPLLPACDDDHVVQTKAFSLIEMVPDLEKNDEDNINEEIDEMISRCVIIPSCPKTCGAADPKEASISVNVDTNDSTNYSLGRRAVHPLKSSLKRSSGCSSPSTVSTSMMSDDEAHALMGEKSVCFSQLEIRSYGVTLGDAPTFNGCPITLDWDFDPKETETYNVEVYEHHRCDRRTMGELVIPPSHREYRLMQSGFSRREIKYAMEEAKQAAKERRKTVESLKRSRRLSLEGMWGKVKLCRRLSSV